MSAATLVACLTGNRRRLHLRREWSQKTLCGHAAQRDLAAREEPPRGGACPWCVEGAGRAAWDAVDALGNKVVVGDRELARRKEAA